MTSNSKITSPALDSQPPTMPRKVRSAIYKPELVHEEDGGLEAFELPKSVGEFSDATLPARGGDSVLRLVPQLRRPRHADTACTDIRHALQSRG